jgi:hypothetical protein
MAKKERVEEPEKTSIPQLEEREGEIAFILQQAEAAARKTTYQWVV